MPQITWGVGCILVNLNYQFFSKSLSQIPEDDNWDVNQNIGDDKRFFHGKRFSNCMTIFRYPYIL